MKPISTCISGLVAVALASPAWAQDYGPLEDTFNASLGWFLFDSKTTLRADGEAGEIGTEIDLERDLGFGDKDSFRLDGFWRFAPRHKLRVLYFSNRRTSSLMLEREIMFDGEVFPVAATVTSKLETEIFEFAYEYAFWRRDSYEIAGSIGAYLADFRTALVADVSSPGVGGGTVSTSGRADITAPLPVVGLHGIWQFPHRINLDLLAQYFYLDIEDIQGSVTDFRIALSWQPKRWLGLGIAYDQFTVDVDGESDEFRGAIDWQYRGPYLFWSVTY